MFWLPDFSSWLCVSLYFLEIGFFKGTGVTLFFIYITVFIGASPLDSYLSSYIAFINVGQGDSCLIHDHDKNILIDTGGSIYKDIANDVLMPFFKKKHIDKLDLVFKNSIKVNFNFTTSDPDIFAIGDVTSIISEIDNSETYIPLAGLANKEGRELANYLINKEKISIKALGTSILKLFDLSIASTGFNETQLKAKNVKYRKIYLTPANHATYYPGSKALTIKVLFNEETYEILGAQIVGEEGVDKRIDLLATMMKFKIKGYELKNLELSYAPPFGSAKDPINMVGYMIENIKNGLVKQFYVEDIEAIKNNPNCMLVDVRTRAEFEADNIEGSINIPIDELRENLAKLDKNKEICLICLSAIRSYIGCRILSQRGYKCCHLAGGFKVYQLYKNVI